jgi:hypothetical protein
MGTVLYVFLFRLKSDRRNYSVKTATEFFVIVADFEYLGPSRMKIASTRKLKADQFGTVLATILFITAFCLVSRSIQG